VDPSLEGYPILSYDPDAGYGYGGSVTVGNLLGGSESFGLLLFGSSRGESRYRLGLSIPDAEFRWGKKFAISVDVGVDFDRKEQTSFYGVGNRSRLSDREQYVRDAFELSTTIGSAVFPQFVAETGWRYRRIVNTGFNDTSRLEQLLPVTNSGTALTTSLYLGARYDTRERLRNPTFGTMIRLEGELGPQIGITNVSFSRVSLWVHGYRRLWYPRTILAGRIGVQNMTGDLIPVQLLLSLGGSTTLRGFAANRFVDRVAALVNGEVRFPLWERLGGVVGVDAGQVWNLLSQASLARWQTSGVLGLRLYLDDIVLRLDAGFSREGRAVYFGLGEAF
jgi:outer membrane protein assembly factor BamA